MSFIRVYGVDFSGAKEAGRNLWVAEARPAGRRLALASLQSMEALCGVADRAVVLPALVAMVAASTRALWAMDFPFGLPVEMFPPGTRWDRQIEWLGRWGEKAYDMGVWCVKRSTRLHGKMHVRRLTDVEVKTPFDCYHYRIVYQTFFGMRDVLGPLAKTAGTAVLPFHWRRLPAALGRGRVVVEACPASTLKRFGLPATNYKQPLGGPLSRRTVRVRHAILDGIGEVIDVGEADRRRIMRNGGGDALDAVIAAVGAWTRWGGVDHVAAGRHTRYGREGYSYA